MNYWERWTPGERLVVVLFGLGLVAFVTVTAIKRMPSAAPEIKFVDVPHTTETVAPVPATQPKVGDPAPTTPVAPPQAMASTPKPSVQAPARQEVKQPPAVEQAETKATPSKAKTGTVININTATATEIAAALPGIGPTIAQRIVDYRTEHGNFAAVEELRQVKGIGPKKLEKIRPYLTF